MGQKKTKQFILRYQGLFDFDGLYKMITSWFLKRDYDYIEKKWKEKEATPAGREITIGMGPTRKITEYIRYWYNIEWFIIDAHPVEVVRDGKTVKLTHARFYWDMGGHVEYDWQSFGKENPRLSKFFSEVVMDKEIKKTYKKALEVEMQQLLDHIKEFLHMETSRVEKVPA